MSWPACLVLADGSAYRGEGFGARSETAGEVVFHTGMTGYQEILTDPSYRGQIVCMTYPEIGNVGTNPEDEESAGIHLRALVVRDHVDFPSSWRSRSSLQEYLVAHGIPGISGIDTRALVRRIRSAGAMNAALVEGERGIEEAARRAASLPPMLGQNLVDEVSCSEPYRWTDPGTWGATAKPSGPRLRVVAYDFGVKWNILRELVRRDVELTVVPARTPAAEALALEPDGVFLSNGPGDPGAVDYAVETVRELVASGIPIFGICLGHQILGLALGGTRIKLRFGHHGANQPAHETESGRVLIASENHGFALESAGLSEDPQLEISYCNLNDRCVEGIRHRSRPIFSVQYHPEASPGPHDAAFLFDRFRSVMEAHRAAAG